MIQMPPIEDPHVSTSAMRVYVDALAGLLALIELLERGAIREFRGGTREANALETILAWSESPGTGQPLAESRTLCRTCGVPTQTLPGDERKSRAHAQACIRSVREHGQVYLNRHDADMFGKLVASLL